MYPKHTSDQTPEWERGGPEPIAIVGMAGRFPRAKNVSEFWTRLCSAEHCISSLTPDDLESQGVDPRIVEDPNYVSAASVLEDVDQFDAAFFGITPREAELMDPQQRIFLECCWEALEDAGYDPKGCGQAMGLFAGARTDTYLFNILTHPDLVRAVGAFHLGLGNDLAFLTSRVSHVLNLTGPAVSVHTACSTSLVAVHLACEALRQRRCDTALAGGVAVNVPHYVGYVYEEGSVQSPDGYCRTFDASARGTVFGSGAGVVLLKRLGDAVASHDSVYAIIRGSAINNDGSHKASFTAPSVQGQVNVIREALRVSEVDPNSIAYVECHGTGTLLGDAIEVRALIKAFGKGVSAPCAIGSVKTNVGHLDAAAGMAGLIKTALSLKHQMIPASLHYVKPNPQINFEGTRFYVNTATSPWMLRDSPRRAGVSAFGVGGTNAHVVLEEAPSVAPSRDEGGPQVLPLSARSAQSLARARLSLADHLREHGPRLSLSDIAFTLQEGRQHFRSRQAFVCSTTKEAVAVLGQSSSSQEAFQDSSGEIPPAVTFLFPGQGAQYLGMGKELYEREPVYRTQIGECSDILRPLLGQDLVAILYEPSPSSDKGLEHDLTETWLAQPALLAVEYALARLWMSWGVQPESMFGHSVGEYTAAALSGVMSIEDALRLVALRGRLMQQTAPGALLAVSQSGADVTPWLTDGLAVAAFNAPDLCTVGGSPDAIRTLQTQLKSRGIACQPLRTSHAFHVSLVEPAMAPFVSEVRKIRLNAPKIPFLSCVTGTWIRPDEAQQPEYWSRQMRRPVQFDAGLTEFLRGENRVLLDVGPGQTLRRLALRKSRSHELCRVVGAMPPSADGSEQRTALTALTELWESGVSVNWAALRRGEARRVSLPTYPFERSRFWINPSRNSRRVEGVGQLADAKTAQKDSDVSRWFWVPSSRLAAPVLNRRSHCGGWMVYCDQAGLGDQVCLELEAVGETVIRVETGSQFRCNGDFAYTINPLVREHHVALWNALFTSGIAIGSVISLTGMNHFEQADGNVSEPSEPCGTDAMNSNLFAMQAMLSRPSDQSCRYFIVSGWLMDIERADRIVPAMAGTVALARTLKDEHENYECRVIDVVPTGNRREQIETAKRIVEEIRSAATDEIIAYRGKKRWIRDFERVLIPPQPGPQNLPPQDGAYLILGGLGSVGLQVAEHLAHAERAKLVLTSRTALPPRTLWNEAVEADPDGALAHRIRTILLMEKAAAEVDTIVVDIADQEQMSSAISYVENRFGRVRGIIHTAGVTSGQSAFRIWAKLDPEDFSIQSRAKLRGLEVLASVIQDKDVPFVLLMSSNSSIVGGLGFAAYAAANCSMNAFAEQLSKQQEGTRWLSVSWDHWPEVRVGGSSSDLAELYGNLTEAEIVKALELKYRYAMTKEEVGTALGCVLSFPGSGHLIVSTGSLPERLCLTRPQPANSGDRIETGNDPSQPRTQRPNLRNLFVAPRNELETALAAIWEDFLGLEQVGIHDDFFELGGHSLLATKLVAQVRTKVGADLPLAKLFEGPTIAQMAENVLASAAPVAK
jgi:phthiocerol/phenolphthiocerol synthesis type-I polyketide synthase E